MHSNYLLKLSIMRVSTAGHQASLRAANTQHRNTFSDAI